METAEEIFAARDARGRLRRRRLWQLGGASVALLAAALAVVVYSDAPPPEVSDLIVVPTPVADDENLYLALIKWGTELGANPVIEPSVPASVYGPGRPEQMAASLYSQSGGSWPREELAHGEAWTPERLRDLGPDLDRVVERARKIALLGEARGGINSNLDPSREIGEVVYHLLLAAWAKWESGRRKDAVEILGLGWRFGQAVRDSHCQLSDHVLGRQVMIKFAWELHEMAQRKEADADTLRQMLAVLGGDDAESRSYIEALKIEFGIYREMLEGFTVDDAAASDVTENPLRFIVKTRVLFPLVYKPNLTVSLLADQVREEIECSRRAPGGRVSQPKPVATSPPAPQGGLPQLYNKYGPAFLSSISIFETARERRARQLAWSAATRAFVALRIHHLETGRLPGRLEELVPGYLPAVPLDPLDGQPVRYSQAYRAVWSAGTNDAVVLGFDRSLLLRSTGAVEPIPPSQASTMLFSGPFQARTARALEAIYLLDFAPPEAPPAEAADTMTAKPGP